MNGGASGLRRADGEEGIGANLDGRHRLETPERVEVEFLLAGLGSRFCAAAIDALILGAALVTLWIGVAFGVAAAFEDQDDAIAWGIALALVAMFLLTIAYHLGCELLMSGQSPGKRSLDLRVVRDDGAPAAPLDLLVRNLLRLVDFLPVFYGVGAICVFLTGRDQRLGDLAAGTLVVKEGAAARVSWRAAAERSIPTPSGVGAGLALSEAERRVVHSFLARRGELSLEARDRVARSIADRLRERHGVPAAGVSAEAFIERLGSGSAP